MRVAPLVLLLPLLFAGCLRFGDTADLHLVCEEKSTTPRMAYGVEFLVSVTRLEGGADAWTPQEVAAILDAARRHLVTPRGAPHEGFEATLSRADDGAAHFAATGRLGPYVDVYAVRVERAGDAWRAVPDARAPDEAVAPPVPFPEPVRAPASLREPARRAAENQSDARERIDDMPVLEAAGWDPELPACVFLHHVQQTQGVARDSVPARTTIVVNVAQHRVVHLS